VRYLCGCGGDGGTQYIGCRMRLTGGEKHRDLHGEHCLVDRRCMAVWNSDRMFVSDRYLPHLPAIVCVYGVCSGESMWQIVCVQSVWWTLYLPEVWLRAVGWVEGLTVV
jgi:hypothetical protein